MWIRSLLKKVVACAGITYVGTHGYLAYHLLYARRDDPLSKISSDSLSIDTNEERKHIVAAVTNLYQLKSYEENLRVYSDDAVFEDPVIRLAGRKNLEFKMRAVTTTFKESETMDVSVTHGENNTVIELTQKYTFRGLGLKITVPSVIYLTLKGDLGEEKVTEHIEEWGGKPLLKSDHTLLNVIPEQMRRIHGVLFILPFYVGSLFG